MRDTLVVRLMLLQALGLRDELGLPLPVRVTEMLGEAEGQRDCVEVAQPLTVAVRLLERVPVTLLLKVGLLLRHRLPVGELLELTHLLPVTVQECVGDMLLVCVPEGLRLTVMLPLRVMVTELVRLTVTLGLRLEQPLLEKVTLGLPEPEGLPDSVWLAQAEEVLDTLEVAKLGALTFSPTVPSEINRSRSLWVRTGASLT